MAKFAFVIIGVLWGAVGLLMLVFPTLLRSSVSGRMREPGFRFVVLQGMVLGGLVLVIGTTRFQGFELWVLLGGLGIALASFLLGCSTDTRDNLVRIVETRPLWLYRLGGIMMVSLAVLFGADIILSGS